METLKSLKDFIDSPFSVISSWLSTKIISSISYLVDSFYYLLLGMAMIALFLYISGYKESKKYTTLPAVVYLLLKILKLTLV